MTMQVELLPFIKLSAILLAVLIDKYATAMHLVILEITIVSSTISILNSTETISLIVFKLAYIYASVLIVISPMPLHVTLIEETLIYFKVG